MTTTEKLAQMEASEARNRDAAAIHRSIEIYARSILESVDTLAEVHRVERMELVELLVNTVWAMEQARSQESR